MITNKQFEEFKQEFDTIVEVYKKEFSEEKKRDWRTYEQQWALRIKTASKEIMPVIEEADCVIVKVKHFGHPFETDVKQKVLILLLKDIFQLSNRKMANLLLFFSAFTGVEVSYKTIERAYSDLMIRMIIHNMFIVMIRRKVTHSADVTGDGTGYSLTITKHYRTVREKEGEAVKSNVDAKEHGTDVPATRTEAGKKKLFTYAFAMMDLGTHMYVGYGASIRSEKAAFNKAVSMMQEAGVMTRSVRLDKYYGSQSTVYAFDKDTAIYIIPKDNTTINGPYAWKDIIRNMMLDPFSFLKEYYRRENSESGFSADKRCDGWKVWQKLDDRIDTAVMCKGVWHNLLLLGGDT